MSWCLLVIHATRLQLAMHQSVDQSFAAHSVIWNHEKQRLGAIFNLIWLQTLQWKQTAPYKATRVPYSLFQTNIITWNERSFVYQRSVKRDFMAVNQIVNKLGFHYLIQWSNWGTFYRFILARKKSLVMLILYVLWHSFRRVKFGLWPQLEK